jgi:hypothetical protein
MKKNLKNFVEAGYKKKSEAKKIDNYILDEDLSTKRDKVYYDPNTGKAVHTIAGTDTLKDWSNNALIPLGLHQYSNRHKNAEKIQKKANEKYGKSNVDLVTHSQSGHIAENLANMNLVGGDNTTLNPAIIGSHNKDIKVVKSIFDPVSALTRTTKNDMKIIPKTFNPIAEHSTDILDKAKKNIFGFGVKALKKGEVNKIMKYRSEDESEASTSEEENEGYLRGGSLKEQQIINTMSKLANDIHKLHQKHGVKSSVIKGFKMLGEGIVRSAVVEPKFKPAVMPPSYRTPTKSSGAGLSRKEKDAQRTTAQISPYTKNIDMGANAGQSNVGGLKYLGMGSGLKGKGATGKMLKNTAANATANLINAGSSRAVNEMETRNTTGRGFKKGSQEAKDHMARIRAMKKK